MLVSLYFVFHISSSVSHLTFIGPSLSTFCSCLTSSSCFFLVIISCGCSSFLYSKLHFHSYHSLFYATVSPDFPLNLSTYFHFHTPTSAPHHFLPTFPCSCPPTFSSCSITSLSLPPLFVCLPLDFPPLCLYEL